MAAVLLVFRDEIRHPDPDLAVRWAMLLAGAVLRERVLFDQAKLVEGLLPADDARLREELARTILGYLRADPGHPARQ